MGSITTSQALGAKQTNLLLRGLRLARTHSSISCFAKKGGSSCWMHMVATDPFQYVPSTSCRCSAEGVGATLFIFKQPWHRPFSEAKKSVPTPQMSREPLCAQQTVLMQAYFAITQTLFLWNLVKGLRHASAHSLRSAEQAAIEVSETVVTVARPIYPCPENCETPRPLLFFA